MMTTLPTSDTHDVAVKRMEWRCRRGMLEMDLLFVDFVSQYLPSLNDAQIVALDQLLDLPDNQLCHLVSEGNDVSDRATTEVLTMLRGEVNKQ
ncbi:MAG: succinate dehydrogenase assembly factor 2 family protein [Methylophilaceae bacterium]|nr:MAG: succinate dehydrogenase assembly factor 2 family protein [Methylophilaceae bacterium]